MIEADNQLKTRNRMANPFRQGSGRTRDVDRHADKRQPVPLYGVGIRDFTPSAGSPG